MVAFWWIRNQWGVGRRGVGKPAYTMFARALPGLPLPE